MSRLYWFDPATVRRAIVRGPGPGLGIVGPGLGIAGPGLGIAAPNKTGPESGQAKAVVAREQVPP